MKNIRLLLLLCTCFCIGNIAFALTTVTINAVTPSNIVEGQGNLLFIINRTGDLPASQIHYQVTGVAKSGSDYEAPTGVVQFSASQAVFTLHIATLNDDIAETSESVIVTILPPAVLSEYQVGTPNSATGTIDDDEPTVTITANSAPTAEITPAVINLTPPGFTITRTGSTGLSLPVQISIRGSAQNGTDYSLVSSPITLQAGKTTATIPVAVKDDLDIDPDETVTVTLGSLLPPATMPYHVGTPGNATITIKDNDPPKISLVPLDNTAEEKDLSTAAVRVRRDGDIQRDVRVNYQVNPGGTSVPASVDDFVPLPGFMIVPKNSRFADIVITPVNDTASENTEKVLIHLAPGLDAYNAVGILDQEISILDDDVPTVSITVFDGIASETGHDTAKFRLNMETQNVPYSLSVKLKVETSVSHPATLGQDFTLPTVANGTIVIPPQTPNALFEVVPIDDTQVEGQEQVTISITADPHYKISPDRSSATIFIADND